MNEREKSEIIIIIKAISIDVFTYDAIEASINGIVIRELFFYFNHVNTLHIWLAAVLIGTEYMNSNLWHRLAPVNGSE
jgi:hypothetical protein